MALKIRLARGGAKKRPFYRIVVAEASAPRDGRYVERVGTYNPMVPKDHEQRMTLNSERISFWMSKGAQPTERVHKMLASAGLMAAPVLRDQPKKSAPGKKRAEREAAAVEAAAKKGGVDVSVPFFPGRTDATDEQTDVDSFAVLEPTTDPFRNFGAPTPHQLVDKAHMLGLI